MRYNSVAQMAKKWNISERSVRNYCAGGRIEGAVLIGKTWNIPEDATKPERLNKSKKDKNILLDLLQDEKASKYKEYVQEIKKGDILVSFSDGIVESLNGQGQQYSVESLLNIIKKNCGSSGKDIANLVKADIQNFCGETEQHDDQTLLVIKF